MARVPGATVVQVAKRVALDQLVFAPPFLAMILTTLLYFEGRGHMLVQHLSDNWFYILKQSVDAMGRERAATAF